LGFFVLGGGLGLDSSWTSAAAGSVGWASDIGFFLRLASVACPLVGLMLPFAGCGFFLCFGLMRF
jgi:hypothetical protein